MPQTIDRPFDINTDVPAWAKQYSQVINVAKTNLWYRGLLWKATTQRDIDNLVVEANRLGGNT